MKKKAKFRKGQVVVIKYPDDAVRPVTFTVRRINRYNCYVRRFMYGFMYGGRTGPMYAEWLLEAREKGGK